MIDRFHAVYVDITDNAANSHDTSFELLASASNGESLLGETQGSSLRAFTDTVDALSLQTSVIGA